MYHHLLVYHSYCQKLLKIIVINSIPYLDLQTLGAGASSNVFRAEMLVPVGYRVQFEDAGPFKPRRPAKEYSSGEGVGLIKTSE